MDDGDQRLYSGRRFYAPPYMQYALEKECNNTTWRARAAPIASSLCGRVRRAETVSPSFDGARSPFRSPLVGQQSETAALLSSFTVAHKFSTVRLPEVRSFLCVVACFCDWFTAK